MSERSEQPLSRRRSPTTIREIASLAGVSTATVSRVINESNKVKKETRNRVEAVMREHHFVADGLAGGLASQRSRTIGLIIPTIANSIYASSTQAVQRVAQAAGYAVLVGVSDFSVHIEAALIHRLLERRVDGLILTGAERDGDIYDKITHNKVPFVITWQLTESPNLPAVSFDNYQAATAATSYMLSLGHTRIGLICGRTEVNDRALERRRAYEDRLLKAGIAIDPALIHECDFDIFEGRAAMSRMIALRDRPTGVFCANDIQAIGAIMACRDASLRVPDDVSIIGFDDLPIAQCTTPRLTTVRVPADEMGAKAAESLVTAIREKGAVKSMELPTDLIVRDSTERLKN